MQYYAAMSSSIHLYITMPCIEQHMYNVHNKYALYITDTYVHVYVAGYNYVK